MTLATKTKHRRLVSSAYLLERFTKPRVRQRVYTFVAIGISLLATSVAANADNVITMAGTFNNWSTNDQSTRLDFVEGASFELVRFWEPGTYQFKFVHNGNWDRHLGDAGNGRLIQPGSDINLTIREPSVYRIRLDLDTFTWKLTMQPPTSPHALFSTRWLSGSTIRLDAAPSLSKPGAPLTTYRWTFAHDQSKNVKWISKPTDAQAEIQFSKPGTYDVSLLVSDGKNEDITTKRIIIPRSYKLELRQGQTDKLSKAKSELTLFQIDATQFGGVTTFEAQAPTADFSPGDYAVFARVTDTFSGDVLTTQELPREEFDAATPRAIVFEPQDKSLSIRDEGSQSFTYNAKDYSNLIAPEKVLTVAVISDFNGWHAERTPLRQTSHDHYEALVLLPDGRYEYKMLVNGVIYLEDKNANPKYRDPDEQGGHNSGFIIGPDATTLGPAKLNQINEEALRHSPESINDFVCMSDEIADVTMRTLAGDVESVFIEATTSVFEGTNRVALRRFKTLNGFDYWRTRIKVDRSKLANGDSLIYHFVVKDGNDEQLFNRLGTPTRVPKVMPWRVKIAPSFPTPDWAKHALWYQIFPERFRNGDPSNDPPRTAPWQHEWYKLYKAPADVVKGSPYDFSESGDFYGNIYDRRYGGDLQGVRENLPYLRELGVTAIYFNPIFLAESLHKYDASDYRHIDDFFGVKDSLKKISGEGTDPASWKWSETDKVFLEFIKEAHAQGFKVIIDGVFNHVGRDFWAFRDVLEKGKDSEYAGWFDIVSWEPFHYRAWDKDDGALPRLKHDDELGLAKPVRDHLFAVTRRWMDPNGDGDPSDGIDGWRLDVAEDINENFWSDWRDLVKEINPDAYIVAEIWHEAREWLDGRTFDAVMNYPFAEACQRFFVNQQKASAPRHFARELETMLSWYPPQVTQVLQNLFDSHDTDRVASMFMNPDLEYDKANRIQDNGPSYDPSRPTEDCYKKLMLMVGLQMTFPNAPMIYYGDEVGMYGADDPSDRKPMYWRDLMPFDDPDEQIHEGLYEHYRRMIALRASYDVLRVGSFQPLEVDAGTNVFAFARHLNNEHALIAINRGTDSVTVNLPSPWTDGTKIVRAEKAENAKLRETSNPKDRATIQVLPDAETMEVSNGHVTLTLDDPYSMAVLISKS